MVRSGFLGTTFVQPEIAAGIVRSCKQFAKKFDAGVLLFSRQYQNYPDIDHIVMNETEAALPDFSKTWLQFSQSYRPIAKAKVARGDIVAQLQCVWQLCISRKQDGNIGGYSAERYC